MLKYLYYRAKFHLAPYLPLKFPVHIDIELAGKCQLACAMCPYGTGGFDESKQGMMPKEMAERALREGRRNGALSCKLNFRGEPGLSKDLIPMIQLAKKLGYLEVMINTNMTAFSKDRILELAESGIDKLIVSVDGADAKTYEKIRIKGNFTKLLANTALFRLHQRPDTRLKIQMVVQPENEGQQEKLKELFPADEYSFQKVQERGQGLETERRERKSCPQPHQRLIVAWDGTIFGCCSNWNNEYSLGNFNEITLRDAWNSDRRRNLLKIAKNPDYGFPCQKCMVGSSYK